MTAKEKAKELVEKYLPHSTGNSNNNAAKQCALIAVDEILSANQIWYADSVPSRYWQKVKNELNQL